MNELPALWLAATTYRWPWWGHLAAVIFILLLIAFFRAFEAAVVALKDQTVQRDAQEGKNSARRLLDLIKHISSFRGRSRVAQILLCMVYGVLTLVILPNRLQSLWPAVPLLVFLIPCLIVFGSILLVFGEMIPQRLAQENPQPFSNYGVYFFDLMSILLWPVTALVTLMFRPLASSLRLDTDQSSQLITEEELRSMLDASREAGHIEAEDKDMIENVFEFDDTIVGEIMTHRIDMSALHADLPWDDVLAYVNSEQYSRFPVYAESIDSIIGVLHTKDLLAFCGNGADAFSVREIMRPAFFTPETRNIKALFSDMKQRRVQMAIVIDEYGGTAGLVTLEDLIEQLVGSIEDEYDDERQMILQVSDDAWIMDGSIDLEDAERVIGVMLPDDYETLSGFVIDTLDRIPDENERPECSYLNLSFKVLTMEDNRIRRLRVTKFDTDSHEEEEDDDAPD